MARQTVLSIEMQAQALMTPAMQSLIKNIKARMPRHWGFGIIFFERSHTAPPTVWVSTTTQEEFVDVAERFVKSSRQAGIKS